MRVEALELRSVCLPLRRPWTTARETLTAREGFLLFTGASVGEALPMPSAGTESLLECQAALEGAARLRGATFSSPEELDQLLQPVAAPCARFALESALLDALAKERGVSVAQLLGATPLACVPVNAVADRGRPLARGFSAYKLKLLSAQDVAWVRSVRAELGPDPQLRLDASGAWPISVAVEVLGELAATGPEYCEDPLAMPEQVPALRQRTQVPVAADGWLANPAVRQRVLQERWADVVILKPAVLGGLWRTLQFAVSASAHGIDSVVTTLVDGVVGRVAALHLAAAIASKRACGLATAHALAVDHGVDPAPVEHGQMAVPSGPGLGVEVRR